MISPFSTPPAPTNTRFAYHRYPYTLPIRRIRSTDAPRVACPSPTTNPSIILTPLRVAQRRPTAAVYTRLFIRRTNRVATDANTLLFNRDELDAYYNSVFITTRL